MTEAEQISAYASVSPEMAALVVGGAELFGFSIKKLRSPTRQRPVFRCRQWIARHARAQGHTWWEIGRALNRDHSTIIHSVRATPSPYAAQAKWSVG